MPQRPGSIAISSGRRRRPARRQNPEIGRFRARHLALDRRQIDAALGPSGVTVDELESPLVWLARRRARGAALIEPHQLQAGERLRRDFTIADLTPRTGANWSLPLSGSGSGGGSGASDTMTDARSRVHKALDAVGPEFSGLLLDVCCFLKGLEDVERERQWPLRSGKIVLRLALERLARHYGYAAEAQGRGRAPVRTWLAPDVAFRVE
ncbi:MAG TPA: DUF6456 domain-containing protein [Pseudolabrys sp.]|nr:DUF6456 domain-containing protein [Pseudolabrys sp.]